MKQSEKTALAVIKAIRKIDVLDVIPETKLEKSVRICNTIEKVTIITVAAAAAALVIPYKVKITEGGKKIKAYALSWTGEIKCPDSKKHTDNSASDSQPKGTNEED